MIIPAATITTKAGRYCQSSETNSRRSDMKSEFIHSQNTLPASEVKSRIQKIGLRQAMRCQLESGRPG